MKSSLSFKSIFFISFTVAVYSLSGLFSKLASSCDFLSYSYFLCLLGVIGVLGCYAVLWQVVLKRLPLSKVYPFRSLSIVFGLGIAYYAFREVITWQNVIGSIIVLTGLVIITTGK